MIRDHLLRLSILTFALLLVGCGFNPTFEKAQAKKAYDAGDYADAAERYNAVAEYALYDWEARYYLGLCYLELGEPIKAQGQLEQALAVKDDSRTWTPRILDALAEAYFQQERYDAMYAFLREAIDQRGTWKDFARQARYLAKAGDNDGAASAYYKACFFSGNNDAEIYVESADFFESIGDFKTAVQYLKWAVYIENDYPGIDDKFERLGVVPGPTLRVQPPEPIDPGDSRIPAL
ncbi:MAG: tetratricopeptide repeat protein [Planctomycetota bacterium]